jgi:Zn-dependent protease with chaperone function
MQSFFTRILMLTLLLYSQLFLPLQARAEGEDDPLWNRPSFEKKVIDVGQRILAANGITERIVFIYDKSDIRNARARRWGGPNTVIIYKDMLDVISSDDELAAVLSHEIAHITKRHTRKEAPKIIGSNLFMKTALITAGTAAIIATGGLAAPVVAVGAKSMKEASQAGIDITGPIERPYEKEADLVGLDYMVKAGYNPLAMETLQMKASGDMGAVANFFASHPGGTERLAYIHEAIKTKYPQFLTADTMTNPLPGAPYQLQPAKTTSSNSQNPSTIPAEASLVTNSPATNKPQPATSSVSQLASASQPSASDSPSTNKTIAYTGNLAKTSEKNTLVIQDSKTNKPPTKVNYEAPKTALQTAPRLSVEPTQQNASTHSQAKDESASDISTGTSVAQVLLSLSSDDLRALKLISQHGYISRNEFEENFEHQDADTVWVMLTKLVNKRLIRIVGADPNEGYVLTDWASDALAPKPHTSSER